MFKRILIVLMACLMILGCNQQIEPEEEIVITILYPHYPSFYEKYGKFFERAVPHIKLRVVERVLQEATDVACCDLIFINDLEKYRELASTGELLVLNDWIRQEDFDIVQMTPFVMDQLYLDDRRIYGLAPRFESKALYYNEQLFEEYGIPLPSNGMTWNEVLELAQRFPAYDESGERIYGFVSEFFRDIPVLLTHQIASTQNLTPIDPITLTVQANLPEWAEIWRKVLDAYQQGVIYDPALSDGDFVLEDPFLEGRAAMQITNQVTAYYLRDLKQSEGRTIDWNVVTVPIQQAGTAMNPYMIHDIFAIAAQSNQKDAAWEFIQYIHSESFTKLTEEYPLLINDGFPSRMVDIPEVDGRSMEPFLIADAIMEIKQETIPQEIINALVQVASEEMAAVLRMEQSIEEALASLQIKGQIAVDEVSGSSIK